MNKPTQTIQISTAEKAALRWLAKNQEMTIGRGSMKDDGSIQKLIASLASGRNALLVLEPGDIELEDKVLELAKSNPELEKLLMRVFEALSGADFIAFYDWDDVEKNRAVNDQVR